jgi:hypothetical protein
MKWDQQRPAKAAVERCQGVLRLSTSSPQEHVPSPFSYTHRPGRSGAHGPAGSGVDFPIPQNSFVWVSLKMGSRARNHTDVRREPVEERGAAQNAAAAVEANRYNPNTVARPSRCSACSLLIYPPTGAQWPARAGGLRGGFLNPAKLLCMGFAKNGLASSQPRGTAGRAPAALPTAARRPEHARRASPGPCGGAPSGLPYTWSPQRAYPIPQPAYPIPPNRPTPYLSQPTYPIPPNRPTLHLPTDLPYTSPKSPTLYPNVPALYLLSLASLPYTLPLLLAYSLLFL